LTWLAKELNRQHWCWRWLSKIRLIRLLHYRLHSSSMRRLQTRTHSERILRGDPRGRILRFFAGQELSTAAARTRAAWATGGAALPQEEQHQTLVKLAINNIFFTFHLGEPSTSGICSLIVFGSVELGVLLNQLGVAKLQLSGIRNEGSKSCAVDLKVHLLRHLLAFPPCNFRS